MNSLFSRLSGLGRPTWRGTLLSVAGIIALLLFYILALIPFTPSIDDLRKAKTAKPSVVMSADGKELASFKRANRDWVKLQDISPHVVTALIATEDHRFYEHQGIDLKRTVSAVLHTATGNMQGGSTITQQLARNLYPEEIGRAPTLNRKLKEAITSLKIESVYSKDEILETYLNTVPFLYNAYGIELAARTYFDKSADELNVLESATLVGMLKGTSYYNPVTQPERALQRRNTVLAQMVKHDKLGAAQFAELKKQTLKIEFERQSDEPGPAPHLSQQIKRWLVEWADRNGYNIFADGLVVRITVDSRLQDMANAALARQADRLQQIATAEWSLRSGWAAKSGPKKELVLTFVRDTKEYKAAVAASQSDEQVVKALQGSSDFMQSLREEKTRLQAGFLAINPANGHVMAWVGSRDFATDQFDHVQQARRQPGSTFKPFVYGAAFEDGTSPATSFIDEAIEIPLGNGDVWRPSDGGGPSGLSMTLREGLMYSKNTITAQVMQVVGPAHVAKLARAMGVRQSPLDEVPSLALGTSPVTLKEMVTAYSTIVNDGRYIEPLLITQVEDRNGKVLEAFEPKLAESAMPAAAAETLLDVMRGVVDQGTGAGIRSRFGIKADVAGKTGTTQDNTDGWFILMHPQLVAGAWVGFNDNRITMGNGWGPGAQSALPIVGEFFQKAIRAKRVDEQARFVAPHGVSVIDPAMAQAAPPLPESMPGIPGTRQGVAAGTATGNQAAGMPPNQLQPPQPPQASARPLPIIKYITITPPPDDAPRAERVPQTIAIPALPTLPSGPAAQQEIQPRRISPPDPVSSPAPGFPYPEVASPPPAR